MSTMLQVTKPCKSCLQLVTRYTNVETASYLNLRNAKSIQSLLKRQTCGNLILSNPTGVTDAAIETLTKAQNSVTIVPSEDTRKLYSDCVTSAKDLENVTVISSRPKETSFLEELDDAYLRGRDVIVSVDPKDTFHSLMFDTHVVSILGAQKNRGICKNIRLGRIQFVDWNPEWMLSPWVCNKVFIE